MPAAMRDATEAGLAGTLREVGMKFGRRLDLVFMQPFLDAPSGRMPSNEAGR